MAKAIQGSLFATIASTIRCNKRHPTTNVLIGEVCWTNWSERNVASYDHTHNRLPCWTLIQRVELKMKAIYGQTTSAKKLRQLERGIEECSTILGPWRNTLDMGLMIQTFDDQLNNV